MSTVSLEDNQWNSVCVALRNTGFHSLASEIRVQLPKPKPDEPRGFGAVVKDRWSVWWVRVGTDLSRPWAEEGNVGNLSAWVTYSQVDPVEVLSHGYSPA